LHPTPAVLVVTHNYPRDPEDQAGQFIQTLLLPLRDRYRFVVLAPHHAGLPEREVLQGIQVVRFRYGDDEDETLAYEGNMHEQVLRSWSKRWLFLRFLRSLRAGVNDLLSSERPRLVHIHWWIPGALASAGLLYRRRVPYVLTTHGSDLTLLDRFAFVRPIARRLFVRAAACTAVSDYLRDRLQERTGVRATVLPMPYDDTKFVASPPPAPGPPVIACVGRFIERKGQKYLLQACAIMRDQGIDFRLLLVGDGPMRGLLEQLSARLSLSDRVKFTGNVPHRDIPALYRDTTVAVLPSVRDWKGEVEGLGMVLAEASACGRAVVGTDLAGVKDAIKDGENGLLVPPADAQALAAALERVLTEPGLALRLGEAGPRFAQEHFSPASQSRKLAALFDEIIGK
jgi:glycosyltransferase involved in cell wall biosynthesis